MKPSSNAVQMSREEKQRHILEAPAEEIFMIKKPEYELPERARLFASVVCEKCGEAAPEYKMRLTDGKKICSDCFTDYYRGW